MYVRSRDQTRDMQVKTFEITIVTTLVELTHVYSVYVCLCTLHLLMHVHVEDKPSEFSCSAHY